MKKNNTVTKFKKKLSLIPLYYIVLPILTLILFLIPILFWFNNSYYVGGDDTLLYYIYPKEMINSYLFNIVTDNVLSGIGSYSVQFYQLPFFLLITIVKFLFPFLNTQTFMYGLNLSMGFLFFYLFLGLFIKNKSSYDFFIKILGGLLYVFSIFSYYTLWQALFTPYLVSAFPITVYLFLKALKDKNINILIFLSLFISLFSIIILLLPWLTLGVIAIIPLFFIIFVENKKRFIIYSLFFILITFLLNFYWFFHLLSPYFNNLASNTNALSDTSSTNFVLSAKNTILEVTRQNNLIYPFFNLFHKGIQASGGWQNYPIFQNWHEKFIFTNFLFTLAILYAGLKLKNTKKEFKKLYLSSTLGWLIVLYMFTVNIGSSLGLNFFVWLIENIPGFTMFRNVYGKIAPAYPFIYALMVVVSLKIILAKPLSTPWKKIILIFCFIIVVLNAKPFIFNEYFNNPMWTTKNTYGTISGFNKDFLDLAQYLKTFDKNSRLLWLPVTAANYIMIRDIRNQNHYYTGLSPLQFLSSQNDIAGIMSFPDDVQKKFTENLKNKQYEKIGYLFKTLNINYFIVNNDISDELQKSYLYSSSIENLHLAQNPEFKKALLGKKIKNFNRYELYEIKDIYKGNAIIVQSSPTLKTNPTIYFKKKKNYLYQVTIRGLKGNATINFLERYSPFWILYANNTEKLLPIIKHTKIYGYANQWQISSEKILKDLSKSNYKVNSDGSIDLDLVIYFKPQSYFIPSNLVSTLTLILIISFYIYKTGKHLLSKYFHIWLNLKSK